MAVFFNVCARFFQVKECGDGWLSVFIHIFVEDRIRLN